MFPETFNNYSIMTFNQHFKARLMANLNYIITGEEKYKKEMDKEDRYFNEKIQPKNLNGSSTENVLYVAKKEYENLCVILKTSGIANPKAMTIIEFFTTLKYLKEKNKPKPKKS